MRPRRSPTRQSAARLWAGRLGLLLLVVAGLLAVLWGTSLACEANPACPWPVLWRSR